MTGTPSRTARVPIVRWDLKEAEGKILTRGTRIACEASCRGARKRRCPKPSVIPRHGWLLRCGRCTGRDRRGPADQDGQGVPTEAAVERSRSHHQHGEEHRTATVEADVTRPSARASRERLLQVSVDHQRWSSSQDTRWENGRSAARVQYAECDDWAAQLPTPSVDEAPVVGTVACQFRFVHLAARARAGRDTTGRADDRCRRATGGPRGSRCRTGCRPRRAPPGRIAARATDRR